MSELRFLAIVGPDQVIRPPVGVTFPEGNVEVIVRRDDVVSPPLDPPTSDEKEIESLKTFLSDIAAEAESIHDSLPVDMAENHDHYAHGAPRR